MAHDLNYSDKLGRHSFVSAKERAWHGLGKVVAGAMTSEECIKLAGLDYKVVKAPNFANLHQAEKIVVVDGYATGTMFKQNPVSFSTVRTDTNQILGSVGRDYTVVQNLDAFAFFDDITKAKEAMFETAGALGKGETIFITAKLPKYIRMDNGEAIENYLLFFNTHDGSRSIEVMLTPVRVVCNNTLTYARHTAAFKYRIRHTKSAADRLGEASKILGMHNKLIGEASPIYNAMLKRKLSDDAVAKYISKVFLTADEYEQVINNDVNVKDVVSSRKYNVMSDVNSYYHNGVGQESIKGTVWGAYNAITGYFQNVKKYSDGTAKILSVTNGDVLNKSLVAFDTAKMIIEHV